MLSIQHLRKSFGTLVAVDDVSFSVERGTLVGLLGPNGAGKTTTVSMIAGLVTPDTRRRARRRARGWRRHRSEEAAHRPGAAGPRALRRADARAPTCASSARSTACRAPRSTRRSRTRSTLVGLADRAERPRRDLQRRHEAAAESGRRPAARSRHAAARRADGRRRSAEPQRDLRQPRDAEGARQGAALHDALHGRGRAPRRSHRRHGPRQSDRRRHAGRPAVARRGGRRAARRRSNRCSSR